MKRSVSRASKVSTDAQDSLENSFPGIPDTKWHEFLEKEETDMLILGLREEILHKCMEICFENYLEKQAVAFTVHCAYVAWCKVLNVFYMFHDPGDADDCKERKSWDPDPEPESSIIDSWGSQCIVPVEPEPESKIPAKEPEKSLSSSRTACDVESVESCAFASDLFNAEEASYYFSPKTFSSSSLPQKKTVFSTALCMSVDCMDRVKYVGCDFSDDFKRQCGSFKKF